MAALIAGLIILLMNTLAGWMDQPVLVVAIGMAFSVVLGAAFGLTHGLLITRGRIEPFIVTLGTLGIFRAYLTYFSNGEPSPSTMRCPTFTAPSTTQVWPAYRSRSGYSC